MVDLLVLCLSLVWLFEFVCLFGLTCTLSFMFGCWRLLFVELLWDDEFVDFVCFMRFVEVVYLRGGCLFG